MTSGRTTQPERGGHPTVPARHLLSIDPLTTRDLGSIVDSALRIKESDAAVDKLLAGEGALATLFFEPSTRTRASFERAGTRLGLHVMNLDVGASSVAKGESLIDTLRTVESLGARFIVMRHASSGVHEFASTRLATASLLNAGDGRHQHPTQALLDCVTLTERFGTIQGRTIAIVGDILHSRVARSNIAAFTKLGARVRLVGPRSMLPETIGEAFGVELFHELEPGVAGADAVYLLRSQLGRQPAPGFGAGAGYHRLFGLTSARLDAINPDAVVLHPGPANPGVECSAELLDSARALVRAQVSDGVAARMAALLWLAGKHPS